MKEQKNDTIETGIGQDYQKVDESLNSHVEYQSEQRCLMDILNLQESVQVCNCCIIFLKKILKLLSIKFKKWETFSFFFAFCFFTG